MAEILKISDKEVKIGTDKGKVITVPKSCISYENPKEGDRVKVFKDGDNYIVTRETSMMDGIMGTDNQGNKSINKHLFVWVATFLLGYLGLDRFLRGQIGMGVCKLLFGWLTLGIWELVDWIIALMKAYGSAYGSDENLTFDAQGNYIK